ncbi:hypothetical protein QUA54_21070 [Microcoleus sp. MOSTC5]|uniref:hypothetical protein n=1 Tax=Microcoleus sp. MOSTC5 TaxID=3055378 RepID=UPI002FCE9B07
MSRMSGRRKFGNGLCNGCNGCNGYQEEGSSATACVTDVTDVTDIRKKEEGRSYLVVATNSHAPLPIKNYAASL